MSPWGKKLESMDYLLIIVGTCLMAVAVISAFDKAGNGYQVVFQE